MVYDLSGRVVAITGGTGGFARALAPALRARGARVALVDVDLDAARTTAAAVGPEDECLGLAADVTDLAAIESALTTASDHFGRLDVVVANAGVGGTPDTLADGDPAQWDRMVAVNLSGVYRTFRAAQPLVAPHRGYLLATSSMAAFVHSPLQGAYPATKAGVWAMCDTWRLEVRHTGVAVGSLHPTFFKTPMVEELQADAAGRKIFGGNAGGLWKMVDIDVVVKAAVNGIERRAKRIVAPRALTPGTYAPGVLQAVVDRFGFPGTTIPDAIALISRPGRDRDRPPARWS